MSGEIGLGEEELTTHIFLSLGDVLFQLFQLLLDVCHSHNWVSLDLIMHGERNMQNTTQQTYAA